MQYCEKTLIDEAPLGTRYGDVVPVPGDSSAISLSTAFTHYLGLDQSDTSALINYENDGKAFHTETYYESGDTIFASGEEAEADAFYVVLSGSVVLLADASVNRGSNAILSGAGMQHVKQRRSSGAGIGQVSRALSVGSVFGFVDFVLKRPRTFSVVAGKDSLIAECHQSGLDELKQNNPDLDRIVDKVLLLCSVADLATRDP